MLLPRTVTMFKMRWLLLRFNQAGGIINHCRLDLAFRKHLRIHSSPSSHGQGFGLIITQHSGPPGSWLGPALPSCTSVPTYLHPQLPHGLQFNPVGLSGWPLPLLPQGHRSLLFYWCETLSLLCHFCQSLTHTSKPSLNILFPVKPTQLSPARINCSLPHPPHPSLCAV